ncbi:hypothetical protein GCM10023314_28450 [Algibacter agarivorans]|uniref:GH16 domain-containing protein n=1 Tax=Algibacter agarivorans TaxID=1109741 RepID=A0ABP9GUH1_9FLAO
MKNKVVIYSLLIFLLGNVFQLASQSIRTGPPKPPMGKRWVLNTDFSDEFNGTALDSNKWLDHHPTWIGRPPGLFMSSQVSIKDGFLQIKGEKMEKDTIVHAYGKDIVFNIKGGAVVSKNTAFLGYYECRVKAAATTMSTTFWFSGKGGEGPNSCDNYSQEWDIQECIGRAGDFEGRYFASGMHSNAHYWYTDCSGEKFDHRAAQVKFEDEDLASEDFHVYGGWWRDKTSASYYYDNREPKHQKFYNKVSDKPMDKPMYMRLVCETYPFPWISLPTDEELADPAKNTVYYDWVRGYELVDAKEPTVLNQGEIIDIYDESIIFDNADIELSNSKSLKLPLSYKANEDREIQFTLLDKNDKKVAELKFIAFAGYANLNVEFNLEEKLDSGTSYKLVGIMKPINDFKTSIIDTSHLIINPSN